MSREDDKGAVGQKQGDQMWYHGQSHSQGRAGVPTVALPVTTPQAHHQSDCRRGGVARGEADEVALRGSIRCQQGEPEQWPT